MQEPNPYFARMHKAIESLARGSFKTAMRHIKPMFPGRPKHYLIASDGSLTHAGVEYSVASKYKINLNLRDKIRESYETGQPIPRLKKFDTALLRVLQIIKNDNLLSAHGRTIAITLLPLKRQCEVIGVPMYETTGKRRSFHTAIDVLNSLLVDGNIGVACESEAFKGILWTMGVALTPDLQESYAKFENLSVDSCSLFSFCKHDEFISACKNISSAKFEQGLQRFGKSALARDNRFLTESFLRNYFKAIHGKKLSLLIDFVRELPREHLNGWPDITILTNENKLVLVEAKSTDKLHYNQVRTLPRIAKIIDHICVLKVKR